VTVKSSFVRSETIRPLLSRTVARTFTTLTFVEKVASRSFSCAIKNRRDTPAAAADRNSRLDTPIAIALTRSMRETPNGLPGTWKCYKTGCRRGTFFRLFPADFKVGHQMLDSARRQATWLLIANAIGNLMTKPATRSPALPVC
jgi:hypothetical protein